MSNKKLDRYIFLESFIKRKMNECTDEKTKIIYKKRLNDIKEKLLALMPDSDQLNKMINE